MAAVATVVAIALVATTMPWQPRTSVGPSARNVSASPSGQGSPEPSPTQRPSTLAYEPVAELTPGSAAGPVLALDSDFRLASLDGTPAAELAARLTVQPVLEFTVQPEADAASVRLRPNEPLTPGAVYRFTLAGPGGNTLDTWAFQARQSVQVVSTLPSDTETDVPLDTGIEITFDQDGVVDPASHVTIRPATSGRFEQHGRVLAFVPDRLKPATVYTVTVSKGVAVAGTGESLADDVRFQFETAATGTRPRVTFQFPDDVVEAATAPRPALVMWAFTEDDRTPPTSARMEVYRLPDLDAAVDAYRTLRGSARWARWSSDDLVPTAGLRRVAAFTARLQRTGESLWFRFPMALPAGSYLVQHPSPVRPIQTVLQVTDVAGYLAVSGTRMLVWANDLVSRGPLARARVDADGAFLGRTDGDGLLVANTPAILKGESEIGCSEPCAPVVIVTATNGRSAFLPASAGGYGYPTESFGGSSRNEGYWLVFHTDRTLYRRTDTVNVWGVVRNRDTGAVPETVDVRLVAGDASTAPSIAALHLRPGPTGAFTGSVRLNDLPEGYYELALRVGTEVIGSTAVSVDRILKPAYRLDVVTGRRVYLEGDRIAITARAAFFEGTPVPGVPLRIDGTVVGRLTTDAAGVAGHRTIARAEEDAIEYGGFSYQSVTVSPARAEEGEIGAASREFIVFPSSRMIDAQSTIRAGRVRVQGSVHLVARDRLETELAAGRSPWELDPRGAPVRGAVVTARFVEGILIRTQVGTTYDFIEKRVVPQYEYEERYQPAGVVRVRTNSAGAFVASVPDSRRGHDYLVSLSVGDPDGHPARAVTFASRPGRPFEANEGASLELTDPTADDSQGYGVGDRIDLTLRDGRPARAADRYLFFVAQRGLRTATVQRSPRYLSTFAPWAPPSFAITGVRFNGASYVEGGEYGPWFRAADRSVEVSLSTNRPRYAPGDQVDLEVATRDGAGRPVAATVIVQAVDEKLFQIGGAFDADPLGDLYQPVSSGILTHYASHRVLREGFGEGGDTTGGGDGERSDFRDALLFEAIDTGPDGRGSTTFRLSDDLTSWRVAAMAITADLHAGAGSIDVPVGLPFFVDASIAPEYLVGDRPSIQVRAYGSALAPGASVRISVGSDSLGLPARAITAHAFENVTIPLPPLARGTHTVTIAAQSGSGSSLLQDRLTRSFAVIESRLERTRTSYVNLAAAGPVGGGEGLTTLVISDASAGRYLPLLLEIAGRDSARLERALASAEATTLLSEQYGAPDGVGAGSEFDGGRYQTPDGGIAPVPYAGSDLQLSALAAIAAAGQFDIGQLRGYLDDAYADDSATRERRIYALAGLAALGAPV
ncbi:MAG TPA: Ig-like domain-containing protein, partial [Candidatus Limnocylindrales bacterium]